MECLSVGFKFRFKHLKIQKLLNSQNLPIDEVQCFRRQSIPLLDFRLAVHGDQVECLQTGFIQVRRLSVDHLDQQDSCLGMVIRLVEGLKVNLAFDFV